MRVSDIWVVPRNEDWGDASCACVGVDYKVETFRKNFRNSQQMG